LIARRLASTRFLVGNYRDDEHASGYVVALERRGRLHAVAANKGETKMKLQTKIKAGRPKPRPTMALWSLSDRYLVEGLK
jgi:hypothetical protein